MFDKTCPGTVNMIRLIKSLFVLMVLEKAEPGVEFQFGPEDNQDAPVEPEKTKHSFYILSFLTHETSYNHLINKQISLIS